MIPCPVAAQNELADLFTAGPFMEVLTRGVGARIRKRGY